MFTRIVVGTDGSETANDGSGHRYRPRSRERCDPAHSERIPHHFGSRSDGGRRGSRYPATTSSATRSEQEASKRLLDEVASRASGLSVETHSVNESPAEAVIGVAEQVGADLIVVGNKGMERRIFGSVPNTIAHKTPCNLLIAKTT